MSQMCDSCESFGDGVLCTDGCCGWPPRQNILLDLSNVSTNDLVEALSKRKAVERIDVAPHTQSVEIVVNEGEKYIFGEIFEGPQIILRVWD